MSEALLPSGFDPALSVNRQAPRLPGAKADMKSVDKAAQEFEAVFLNQMLSMMWETVEVDPNFGGGHGEEMFRSVMIDEQAKAISRAGGLGLADSIRQEMLRMQEVADRGGAAIPGDAR
ncbi:MAG TPA: rod-binding protein [Azospirillaceae bacterium]|nr:rod-binding protein [Azospirillaceae bacterium]